MVLKIRMQLGRRNACGTLDGAHAIERDPPFGHPLADRPLGNTKPSPQLGLAMQFQPSLQLVHFDRLAPLIFRSNSPAID